jgi:transcriptional regulator with XRE-family HTH domain
MQLPRTKEWREAKGLTQRGLAAEAHVGDVTVARIEMGYSVTPSTARKVAEALGVEVADLLESPPVPLGQAPRPSGQEPKKSSQRRVRAQETLERTQRRAEASLQERQEEDEGAKQHRAKLEAENQRINEAFRELEEAIFASIVRDDLAFERAKRGELETYTYPDEEKLAEKLVKLPSDALTSRLLDTTKSDQLMKHRVNQLQSLLQARDKRIADLEGKTAQLEDEVRELREKLREYARR